ncbi:MAG: hypothetical protein FRX49_06313 [Trebouxia sp. A1-2]|nr:MAG: hypothetical protein FRX49_06313 [Trebouxia sp. A1-2]
MSGGVAAKGPLAALVKREEEGACCLERRLSSLSTCFITFSVSFMRACSHTTSSRSTPHTFSSMMLINAAFASGHEQCLASSATGNRLQGCSVSGSMPAAAVSCSFTSRMNARSSSNKPLLRLNSSCSSMQQHCGARHENGCDYTGGQEGMLLSWNLESKAQRGGGGSSRGGAWGVGCNCSSNGQVGSLQIRRQLGSSHSLGLGYGVGLPGGSVGMMRAVTALAHMLSWYNAVVDTAVVDNTAQLSHILKRVEWIGPLDAGPGVFQVAQHASSEEEARLAHLLKQSPCCAHADGGMHKDESKTRQVRAEEGGGGGGGVRRGAGQWANTALMCREQGCSIGNSRSRIHRDTVICGSPELDVAQPQDASQNLKGLCLLLVVDANSCHGSFECGKVSGVIYAFYAAAAALVEVRLDESTTDVLALAEVDLNQLAKTTTVVVAQGSGIAKGLQQWVGLQHLSLHACMNVTEACQVWDRIQNGRVGWHTLCDLSGDKFPRARSGCCIQSYNAFRCQAGVDAGEGAQLPADRAGLEPDSRALCQAL